MKPDHSDDENYDPKPNRLPTEKDRPMLVADIFDFTMKCGFLSNLGDPEAKLLDSWESREDYRICLRVTWEDGVFTAVAVNLPGVGSQGNTKKEAILNVKEAAKGVIESYIDSDGSIPWTDIDNQEGCIWVYVNA